ncbi:MAG: hypothetical protein WC341_17690 [Bacteroidales bacterium]
MYGTCVICGCTDESACVHPTAGPCWWIDETHQLCSHCVEYIDDPEVTRGGMDKGCCMCPFELKKQQDPLMCARCKKKDFTPEETDDLIRSGLGLFIHNDI